MAATTGGRRTVAARRTLNRPTNRRIDAESYRASSTAGSLNAYHCYKKWMRSVRSRPTGRGILKVMKRMAYCYRDGAYFFMKIRAAFPGNPR
ncbi:hypothetical protein FHW69_002838 [Luteibacter sp. Sphag1AF]|nr:hypothetical protein [Luteibacter sp. Sphag1AF]